MAGTIVVDRIESDGSYSSKVNVASTLNIGGGYTVGGEEGSLGSRNIIINGDMRVSQRYGTSAITTDNTGSQKYMLDRWATYTQSGGGSFTVQQVTDVPSGQGFINSLKATSTVSNTSPGAISTYTVHQRVEGLNSTQLFGGLSTGVRTHTVSFWVKSNLAQEYGGVVRISNASACYPFSYTINQSNTWEKKTIVVPSTILGNSVVTNTGESLSLMFALAGIEYLGAPGSYKGHGGTLNTWEAINVHGPKNMPQNFITSTGNTWYVTGVQIELGNVATPYEHRPYATELQMCKRYYTYYFCNLYASWGHGNWIYNPSTSCGVNLAAQTGPMRASATMSLDSSVTNLYGINTSGTTKALTNISVRTHDWAGTGQVQLQCDAASGWDYNYVTWSVGASGQIFKFDAEL